MKEFARVREPGASAAVLHGDARELELGGPFDAVVTSPPYPGLIDYHEQHRYAYELLGARRPARARARRGRRAGRRKAALAAYAEGIADVLANVRGRAAAAARRVVIVVNDRRELYPEILERAGLRLEQRLRGT